MLYLRFPSALGASVQLERLFVHEGQAVDKGEKVAQVRPLPGNRSVALYSPVSGVVSQITARPIVNLEEVSPSFVGLESSNFFLSRSKVVEATFLNNNATLKTGKAAKQAKQETSQNLRGEKKKKNNMKKPALERNFHSTFLIFLLPVATLAGLLVPVVLASVIPGNSGRIIDAVKPNWVETVHLIVLGLTALLGAVWLGTAAFQSYRDKSRAFRTLKTLMPWAVGPALCWILALNLGIGGLVESERNATDEAWSDVRNQASMIIDQNQCESPQDINACISASTRLKALGADYEEISPIRWCNSCRAPTSHYFLLQAERLEATAALLANASNAGANRLRVSRDCDGLNAVVQEKFRDDVCMVNVYADLFYLSSTRGFLYEISLNDAGRRACPTGFQLSDDLSDAFKTFWTTVSDLTEASRGASYIRARIPSELLGLREKTVSSFVERGIWLTTEDWRDTPIFTLPVSRTSTICRLSEGHFSYQTIAVP